MSHEADFTRAITSSKLPKYRLDRSTGADANTLEKPLLRDIMYDARTARAEAEALRPGSGNGFAAKSAEAASSGDNSAGGPNSSSPSSASAGGATSKDHSGAGASAGAVGGDRQQGDGGGAAEEKLSAWRLQIRAIFFPRAHVIAQQRARRGEAVAVLDQSVEWFELLSLFLTVANIIVVAVDDPTIPDQAPVKVALDKFDTFFSLFYLFEMIIRILSFGVDDFWADAFNRLDALVVAFGITSLALKLTDSSLANITFVRALRVLRPLRTMTQFRQTRLTVASVIGSFRELLDVWLLFLIFFGVLCVLALDPFRGVLRSHCFIDMYEEAFENLPRYNSSYDRNMSSSNTSRTSTTTAAAASTAMINSSLASAASAAASAYAAAAEQQKMIDTYNEHYRRAVFTVQQRVLLAGDPHNLATARVVGSIHQNASWRKFLWYNLSTEPLLLLLKEQRSAARRNLVGVSLVREVARQEEQQVEHVIPYECPASQLMSKLGTENIYSPMSCKGRLCSSDEGYGRLCPFGYTCLKSDSPSYGFLSFDNLFVSALTTFVLLTTSAWADVYTMMYDANAGLAGLYCVVAVIVGRYFVVSIVIAIVTDRFREKHRQQMMLMQAQDEGSARASKRIRVKSMLETSLEALERYFAELRHLEEIEIHHDFASSLEEDVLVKRIRRDWDGFRFVDEDLFDTQASMIRRSASMVMVVPSASDERRRLNVFASNGGGGGEELTPEGSALSDGSSSTRKSKDGKGSSNNNSNSKDSNQHDHFMLDPAARRRRWFAREIVFKKWFLWVRLTVSSITLMYLATEFEGFDEIPFLPVVRVIASVVILAIWCLELVARGLSRRWLLLATDAYYMVELFCATFLLSSLLVLLARNGEIRFGSLAEAFFLGRVSVYISESHRITALYRWVRIIVAALRSSIVLIGIIVLALFLLACTGMQVFGAQFCSLERPTTVQENIAAIAAGTCTRPRSNFDSFGNAMTSAFQLLTGNEWHSLMYAGMQSVWNRNRNAGGYILVAIIALNFVAAFIVLNYLFANLFISILLNSRAVNEEELRREAVRIQRELHYEKLLARRQLQLEAGLYDVAAVASALFDFDKYFRGASLRSRRVMDALFSDKCVGRIVKMRSKHVFSILQFVCITIILIGLVLTHPNTPPDTPAHWAGSALIHASTIGFTLRFICEIIVESFKMRVRKINKQKKNRDEDDDDDGDMMFGLMSGGEDGDETMMEDGNVMAALQRRERANSKNSDDDNNAGGAGGGSSNSNNNNNKSGAGSGAGDGKKAKSENDKVPLTERYSILSYLSHSKWHGFEAFLTLAGIFWSVMRIFYATENSFVWAASCILCFRPLCYMEKATGLKAVLRDILHMLRNLLWISTIIIAFYFFYSLLGVQLLRGKMSVCHGNETITTKENCVLAANLTASFSSSSSSSSSSAGAAGAKRVYWGPVPLNFDDLPAACYTLYAVATFSDWTDVYYAAQSASPTPLFSLLVDLYFYIFIIAGGMFAQALVTMMLIDTFEVRRLGATERVSNKDQARAISEERFAVQQRLVAQIVPRQVTEMRRVAALQRQLAAAGIELGGDAAAIAAAGEQLLKQEKQKEQQQQKARGLQGLGQRGLRAVQSTWFRAAVGVVVFLSFSVSASYRYPMSDFWTLFNYYADALFTFLFCLELLVYLTLQALCVELPRGTKWYKKILLRVYNGWVVHFSSKWNVYDAIIVLLAVLGIVLERYAERWSWTKNFRALRALRLLRLAKNNPRIANMVGRIRTVIKHLFFVSIIFAFAFVCFGLLGMRLFSRVKHDTMLISDRVGFSTFLGSLVMMMRIATLNRWPAVTIALAVGAPDCDPNIGECGNNFVARTFMLVTTIVFGFVLSNMFVAVLVDAYMSKRLEGVVTSQCALTVQETTEFAEKFVTWPTMDPVYFTIPSEHVVPFLRSLRRATLLRKKELIARGQVEAAAHLRVHPFALPVCELRWRQPQWDLLAVQQLNLKEYSPGLIDYWSLINALCDLRFVRDVTSARAGGAAAAAATVVKAGVLERSKEKMLKRKFLLKVPARQQQLRKKASSSSSSIGAGGGRKPRVVDDGLDDDYDEEDEEINPAGNDDAWDVAMNTQPRMLTEVYAVTRLRDIMLSMPKWRGFLQESTAVNESSAALGGGGAGIGTSSISSSVPSAGAAAAAAGAGGAAIVGGMTEDDVFGRSDTGIYGDPSLSLSPSLAIDGSLTPSLSHFQSANFY